MMIAARNAFLMGGAKTPTARDYVQDGLMAMWDGIENAGWGTHDSTATTWRDLIADANHLTLHNGAHFDDNSLVTAPRNSLTASLPYRLGYVSIEACVFRDESRNSSALICFGNDADNNRMLGVEPDGGEFYNGIQIYGAFSGVYRGTWTAVYTPTAIPYVNGAQISGSTRSNDWNTRSGTFGLSGSSNYSNYNLVGNYYCVRLYNRALTAAEVAANYAVDAARFGL